MASTAGGCNHQQMKEAQTTMGRGSDRLGSVCALSPLTPLCPTLISLPPSNSLIPLQTETDGTEQDPRMPQLGDESFFRNRRSRPPPHLLSIVTSRLCSPVSSSLPGQHFFLRTYATSDATTSPIDLT
ncbi:hypothetical protein TYRP_014256 [Tyrophagus putrescentiae]|nr:hypothetical protein TYRP_014256 [Tyrophagus putrescentiae]